MVAGRLARTWESPHARMGGGGGPVPTGHCRRSVRKQFFFFGDRFVSANKFFYNQKEICYSPAMDWRSLPYEPRKVQATEARLDAIYNAARLGLKGDNLALAAGLLPSEYRRLCQFDPLAELAELKGRADGEMVASRQLHEAAAAGDAKAALEILKFVHKWSAPQSVQIQVEQKISIVAALEEARTRVIEGSVLDTVEAVDAGTSNGLLTNRDKDGGYDVSYARQSANATEV